MFSDMVMSPGCRVVFEKNFKMKRLKVYDDDDDDEMDKF